ncbi:hypothetical protein D3C78_1316030 [compost metagenome]
MNVKITPEMIQKEYKRICGSNIMQATRTIGDNTHLSLIACTGTLKGWEILEQIAEMGRLKDELSHAQNSLFKLLNEE